MIFIILKFKNSIGNNIKRCKHYIHIVIVDTTYVAVIVKVNNKL